MAESPDISTPRLRLRRLTSADVPAMSWILSDPHVAIRIMCDPSTPEKSLREAARRIDWFNSYWSSGYGVRGVAIRDSALGDPGELVGWCGVAGFEGSQGDPEILYGLARPFWGRGIVTEAGRAAIDEFFASTDGAGLCAIIFEQLNRDSIRVAVKLGMTEKRRVAFRDFAPDADTRGITLDFALWCAESSAAGQDPQLRIDAAAKAGLIVGSGVGDGEDVEARLRRTCGGTAWEAPVMAAYRDARDEPSCPYFSLSRGTRATGSLSAG